MIKPFSGKDGKWTPERSMVTWSFHTKSPEQLCPKLNQRLPGISSAEGKGNLKIPIEWALKTERKRKKQSEKDCKITEDEEREREKEQEKEFVYCNSEN